MLIYLSYLELKSKEDEETILRAAPSAVFHQQQPAFMLERHKQRPWGQLALGFDPGLSLADHLFCPSVSPPSPFPALHVLFPLLEMILNQSFPELIPSGLSFHAMSRRLPWAPGYIVSVSSPDFSFEALPT